MDLNALAKSTGLEEAERELLGAEWTLEFVSSLVAKHTRELDRVNYELSKQIHGQVEDAKFAKSIIDNAEQDLQYVLGKLGLLSAQLDFLRQASAPFETLKRASTAKRNLSLVTEQIDLYRKVPIRVKRLLVELELDERGANLRRIFREWLGLCVWRDRVINHVEERVEQARASEARNARRARGEVLALDSAQQAMADSMLLASSQALETQLALLKDHFRDSYLLGDRLTEICLAFVPKLVETARHRPQDLVIVAEICELGDRQANRERKDTGKRKQQFLQCLGEYVDVRAGGKLASLGPMPVFIAHAEELLVEALEFSSLVAPCFPVQTMDIVQVYRKWMEAHLLRECTARAKELDAEEDGLALAAWIARYVAALGNAVGLERFCDTLVENHLENFALVRIGAERTGNGQDFFAAVRRELDICLPHFTGQRLLRVFKTLVEDVCVNQYLQDRKALLHDQRKSNNGGAGAAARDLCEFIEDCAEGEDELRLLFDACTEQLLASTEESALPQIIAQAADAVEEACATFQQAAFDFGIWPLVTKQVFAFGNTSVLAIHAWFFSDRIVIKHEAAFARTLRFAFETLIKTYVQNLLERLPDTFSMEKEEEEEVVGAQMEQDAQAMLEYFSSKRELMWMSSDELELRLHLLHLCAKALRGEEEYGSFLDHFNVKDAKLVLRRLRQLAQAGPLPRVWADLDQEFALYETKQLVASRVELDFAAIQARVEEEEAKKSSFTPEQEAMLQM